MVPAQSLAARSLLPLWEKVPEGRMKGLGLSPHPALRVTLFHKGRGEKSTVQVPC